jgi:ABC-type transporter MlaC component
VLFAVRTPGEHPATLSFLWAKDNGQWKIVAYQMVSP